MILFEETKSLKLLKDGSFYEVEAVLKEVSDIDDNCLLTINIPNHVIEIKSDNFFSCLYKIKEKYPNILIYCKGYKVNVYPSRMAAQMSSGLVAYELEMGRQAKRTDIVRIFDFEDSNLTSSNKEQKDFYIEWLSSFSSNIKE